MMQLSNNKSPTIVHGRWDAGAWGVVVRRVPVVLDFGEMIAGSSLEEAIVTPDAGEVVVV